MANEKLTEKQKRFVDEYLIDLNATQAAIRAGYSPKTAYSTGQRLLKNVEIQIAIQEAMEKREKRTGITQDRVLEELAQIGFSRITDFVEIRHSLVLIKDTKDIPPDKIGAVASIEQGNFGIKIKLNDKLRALEQIGRHLGLFDEKKIDNSVDNNLLTAIENSTRDLEEEADDLRTIQQETVDNPDLVE